MKPIRNLHCIEYLKFAKLTLILFGEAHVDSNVEDKLVLNDYIVKFLCNNKLSKFVLYREEYEQRDVLLELVEYFKAEGGDGSLIDSVFMDCLGESTLTTRNEFYKFMIKIKAVEPGFVINLFNNMVYYDEKTFEFIRSFLIIEITKKGCCPESTVKTYFDIRGDLILKLLLKNMANFEMMYDYISDLEFLKNWKPYSNNGRSYSQIIQQLFIDTPILEIYFIIVNDIHVLFEREKHDNVILVAGAFHTDFVYEMYRYLNGKAKEDRQLSSFVIHDSLRFGGDMLDDKKVYENDLINLVKYLHADKKIF